MKRLTRFFLLIGVFFLVEAFFFESIVSAASTASVTATVTVQNISVTVTDGAVAFGTLGNNSSAGTNGSDTQTANNNGNITENLNIKGQNSTGWTLAATPGSDQYVLKFCPATCATPPTNYTALTLSYQALATGIGASANQTFDLYITTPNPSTVFTQQSVDVTVQAAAP